MQINEPISIVQYDPGWPTTFNTEKASILNVGQFDGGAIEHFGSTAVPGLVSKPIVDILVGVERYPPSHQQVEALRSLSYEPLGESGVPGRFYFRKRGVRAFNVAVVQLGGDLWHENLLVRDYLRVHPDVAAQYAQLKSSLLANGQRYLLEYSSGKEIFMCELLTAAKTWKQLQSHGLTSGCT